MLPKQYQAKQPVTVLAGTYGHPLHPTLVTIPIGAWVLREACDQAAANIELHDWLPLSAETLRRIAGVSRMSATRPLPRIDEPATPGTSSK